MDWAKAANETSKQQPDAFVDALREHAKERQLENHHIKTVVIAGCISSGFDAYLIGDNDDIIEEHNGVVLPQFGEDGDFLHLEIDNATGRINNWKPIDTFETRE